MLIDALQTRFSKMCLLGLTATPTYTDERKRGWLKVLFPQGFIDQVTPQKLIAANILSRPQFEELRTNYVPTFDPREYEKWLGTYRDLPEHVIEHLASSRERNEAIASHYVENRDRYGKTIIFADRWFQCEALREALLRRKIRADVVYSHVDASGSTPDERNRRTRDENSLVLQRFRENKIDVLINVRMLTEGTDIPDVQTVFLTRQTTSRILLTQMIGRALRGPKFGGTEDAFIVSFIDDWKQAINWAEYRELDGDVDPTLTEVTKRPPLHLISIDLVRRLARQMDSGRNIASGPFATLLPLGWFRVEFQVLDEETDTLEATEHVIMVFEGQQESYERFIKSLKRSNLTDFASEDLLYEAVSTRIQKWRHQFFDDTTTSDSDIENNLLHIARHVAQTGGSVPQFFSFEERKNHDLDVVANTAIEQRLDPLALNESVRHEYERSDRYWRAIYGRYELFKTQFDACVNRQIGLSSTVTRDQNEKVYRRSKRRQREPSESTKRQVKIRDHYRCLCCGEDRRRRLEIDHINPYYLGGASDDLENLQTLCRLCNGFKGTNGWNYRLHESSHSKPGPFAMPAMPKDLGDADDWSRFVQRAINSAYGCSAVEAIRIGRRGKYFYRWEVTLYAGNDASGLKVGLSALLNQIRSTRSTAGYGGPDELVILPFKGRQVVCKSRK
jgi:superfamily II DNA or RNA helicase